MANWSQLLTTERLRSAEGLAPGDEGNEFFSDYYRVVFASSFRRLQDKTQVSPLAETDYVRKRLTHSFEVAAVGERMGRVIAHSLGKRIGGPNERDAVGKIVATACLLHDIGNPPFGHEGELAIRAWADEHVRGSADYRCFDGNAQGFRIAVRLQHLGKPYGMNLTAATLATMLKYPDTPTLSAIAASTSIAKRGKWSILSSERPHYEQVARLTGLELGQRHPLSFIVEAADDIVNRLVDIEDAIKLKLIDYSDVSAVLDESNDPAARTLLEETEDRRRQMSAGTHSERQLWAYQYFRVRATARFSQACEKVFIESIEQLEDGKLTADLISISEHAALYDALRALEYEKIFGDPEIVRTEAGGKRAIRQLLTMFYGERSDGFKLAQTMPVPFETDIDIGDDPDADVRRVVDYVAGMTDRYAVDLYQQLSGMSL